MKPLLLPILILLLTFPLAYADPEADYFPLAKGNYWIYQDQIEIQDIDGDFEVYNKYIGEKVKVKRIDALCTLKVLSIEDRGPLKIAKMQEEDFQGVKTFYYMIKDGREIYRFNDEEDLKQAITEDELPIYSLTYVFPLQEGSGWGDPTDLNRKDKMYFHYVEGIEDVTVPADTFRNCLKIIYHTVADETVKWFYPNVGVVRMEYHHHGTITNHISELTETNLTSPPFPQVKDFQYPKVTLKLEGDKIILKQGENTYSFPPLQEEYAGIKKVLQEDIDGDGEKEYILAVQYKMRCGSILICKQKGNDLEVQRQIITGECFPDFELADVNKDGIKDVVATGFSYMHWRHLRIISWQSGKYVFLWDKGETECLVKQIFRINEDGDAEIRIGSPTMDDKGYINYKELYWQIWVWNGEKFVYTQVEETPASIMEKYGNAVVFIATVRNDEELGLGSGFIVKSDGAIVTNYHVIEGAYPALVKLKNGDIYEDISVIDYNERKDVAVIKIKGFDLPVVKLGNSNKVKVGERVVVIGSPPWT